MASGARVRKGTCLADFPVAHDPAASSSAAPADRVHALQEKLQDLIRANRSDCDLLVKTPEGVDALAWQYEHLRQTVLELNNLVLLLNSCCKRDTCPKMTTTEKYVFMCTVHSKGDCCAIDYIVHTLDSAMKLLNKEETFPSRIAIKPEVRKDLCDLSRRLYRLFSHAYHRHAEQFAEFEATTHLTERFTKLVNTHSLLSMEFQDIPPNGIESKQQTLA